MYFLKCHIEIIYARFKAHHKIQENEDDYQNTFSFGEEESILQHINAFEYQSNRNNQNNKDSPVREERKSPQKQSPLSQMIDGAPQNKNHYQKLL